MPPPLSFVNLLGDPSWEKREGTSPSLSVSLPNALIGVRDKSGLGNGRSASFALVAAAAVVACPVVFAVVARVNQDGR